MTVTGTKTLSYVKKRLENYTTTYFDSIAVML